MQDQPQPAWEQLFDEKWVVKSKDQEWWETDVFNEAKICPSEAKDFIRSLLATERLKFQEEARREIEEVITGRLRTIPNIPLDRRVSIFDELVMLRNILSKILTPPPQEETN